MPLLYKQPDYKEFKKLSLLRIKEAKILMKYGQYSGAYYLAGYSVEFALKACYCKTVKEKSFPPGKDVYSKLYSHDLNNLLDVSGIKSKYEKKVKNNKKLESNWGIVKDWNEKSRYYIPNEKTTKSLIKAIQGKDGILKWILNLW